MPPVDPTWVRGATARLRARNTAFWTRMEAHPRLFYGGGAAILAAPLFFKSDERGYFQTSLITTPLIVAGTSVAKPVWSSLRSETTRLSGIFGKAPVTYGFRGDAPFDVVNGFMKKVIDPVTGKEVLTRDSWRLQRAYEKREITQEDYLRIWTGEHRGLGHVTDLTSDRAAAWSQFNLVWNNHWEHRDEIASLKEELKAPDLPSWQREAIEGEIEALKAERRRLVQNAFYRSELDVISAADLANRETKAIAPDYTYEQLEEIFTKYHDNPQFMHGLQGRLQQASRVSDPRLGGVFNEAFPDFVPEPRPVAFDVSLFGGQGNELLKQGAGLDVHDDLMALLKSEGRVKDAGFKQLQVIAIPDRNKAINEILALRVVYGHDDFHDIYLSTRGGSTFRNEMIFRGGVYDAVGNTMDPKRYLIRNIDRGKTWLERQQADLIFWARRDPLDQWNQLAGDAEGAVPSDLVRAKYARQFRPSDERGAWHPSKGFTELDASDQVTGVTDLVRAGRFTKVSGGNEFWLVEGPEDKYLEPFGMVNPKKESLERKSITTVELAGVDPEHRGFFRTDYLTNTVGRETPTAGVITAQLSPAQQGLFADLPDWNEIDSAARSWLGPGDIVPDDLAGPDDIKLSTAIEERYAALERHGYNERIIQRIMEDQAAQRISRERALEAWKQLSSDLLGSRHKWTAAQRFGKLGEGARILSKEAAGRNAYVREIAHYDVDDPRLTRSRGRSTFNRDTVIGFKNGNAVFADGDTNRIVNLKKNGDGSFTYVVEKIYGEGLSGAKVQDLVKEQVIPGIDHFHVGDMTDILNKYYEAVGSPERVAKDVQGFAIYTMHSDKAVNPAKAMGNQTAALLRTLESRGALGNVRSHLDKLAALNLDYVDGELIYRTASRAGGEREMKRALYQMQQLFADVSEQLMNTKIRGDEMMQNAVAWMRTNGHWQEEGGVWKHLGTGDDLLRGNLDIFAMRHHLAESVKVADHVNRNIASQVKVTFDALQDLAMTGQLDITRELVGRLRTHGDTAMTHQFMAYVDAGDFSAPLGAELSVTEALGQGEVGLFSAEGRAGTIFDPGHVTAQKNYSIRLGDGSYVPVLGHEAFGGQVNRYGAGEMAANAWERPLKALLEGNAEVLAGRMSSEDFAKLRTEYLQATQSAHGLGKGGYLRAERFDPFGYFGKESVRRSTLRYADGPLAGEINPNEVGVGDAFLEMFDKDVRARLLEGEHVEALLTRHPIEGVMPVLLKYDKDLGSTFGIGVDPMLALAIGGDADGDNVSIHLAYGKAVKNDEVTRIVRDLAEDQMSQDMYQYLQEFGRTDGLNPAGYFKGQGYLQNLAEVPIPGITHPADRTTSVFGQELWKALRSRSGAAATGALSNTHAQLQAILAHSDHIRAAGDRKIMNHVLYELVRQSPINAAKMQNVENKAWDYGKLMGWNKRIEKSLQNREDPEAFWNVMMEGAEALKGKDTPYANFVRDYKSLFMSVQRDYDQGRWKFVKHLTASQKEAERLIQEGIKVTEGVGLTMPGLRAASGAGQQMAEQALAEINTELAQAKRLKFAAKGLTNETLGSLGEVIRATRGKGVGKTLLIGAGVAAGAGLLFGSMRSPREGQALAPALSSNAYRPEDRIGTDGHIPGEPEAGVMAPSNPPRAVRPGRPGVQTAVVAPMHHNTNLEVTMRTDDSARAHELAKHMAAMSTDGDSNVTINYRDGNRLDSLRTRERIRDTLNRD